MKRVFRVEVETDSSISINGIIAFFEEFADTEEVKVVELKSAQPAPVVNLGPTEERKETPTGEPRKCGTNTLQELIRKDPMCEPYKIKQNFAETAVHMLVMVLPFVNVEDARGIMVHRVEAYAKLEGTMKPYIFTLEIPDNTWKSLKVMK